MGCLLGLCVARGVQAWLRQFQGLSSLAVLLAWEVGELSGSCPSWAPTFASKEKGTGQGRQYCLSCCEVGVCCMQHAQVLCHQNPLIAVCSVLFPLNSVSPRHHAAANGFSWVPPVCYVSLCKELVWKEWWKCPFHPGSHHPTEKAPLCICTDGKREVLLQQEP